MQKIICVPLLSKFPVFNYNLVYNNNEKNCSHVKVYCIDPTYI